MQRLALLFAVLLCCSGAASSDTPKRPRIFGIARVQIFTSDISAARSYYSKVLDHAHDCNWCEDLPGRSFLVNLNQGFGLSPDSSPAPSKVKAKSASTIDETYALYNEGLSIEEICQHRGLTAFTVEKHLAECIMQGRLFDISSHVSDADRALIEIAIDQLGTQLLRPLRDALPPHINYRMIRFVVADVQRAEQSRR